jgi:hypothetical protein
VGFILAGFVSLASCFRPSPVPRPKCCVLSRYLPARDAEDPVMAGRRPTGPLPLLIGHGVVILGKLLSLLLLLRICVYGDFNAKHVGGSHGLVHSIDSLQSVRGDLVNGRQDSHC